MRNPTKNRNPKGKSFTTAQEAAIETSERMHARAQLLIRGASALLNPPGMDYSYSPAELPAVIEALQEAMKIREQAQRIYIEAGI